MNTGLKRFFALILALLSLSLFSAALAETTLDFIREDSGANYVTYPQLNGLDNTFVQDTLNAAIKEKIQPHLNTLLVLQSGTAGELKVVARAEIFEHSMGQHVLAVLLKAEGRMPNGRSGYQAIPMMYSLADAQEIPVSQILTDVDEARAHIEQDLDGQFADELSNYLDISALSPFPIENYLLTQTGITFFYPENSLSWLSGRSASITYLYHELKPMLNLEEGSLLSGLNIKLLNHGNEISPEDIKNTVAGGSLPGLDVRLGDTIESAIAKNKLQYDAEGFPTGEKYQLEDDTFRGTKIIANSEELVTALLSTRMNLYGLITGVTNRQETLTALGQPVLEMEMSQASAEQYGLPEGKLLTYPQEGTDLKLYFDASDTLYAIWIEKTP